ncbi:hypothetical protein BH11BAC2_BH11BAC2_02450 [soil metagenome]
MRYWLYISLLLCLNVNINYAQVTSINTSFNNQSDRFFKFHYDNDFFTSSDQYYSQGITLELRHPELNKSPLSYILPRFKNSAYQYGIAVFHVAYTPSSIRSEKILYGDRPFCAELGINNYVTSINSNHCSTFTSSISIGVIGPLAGGKEMQKSIHRWLNNIQPLGWQNQIENDLLITYHLQYEKKIIGNTNHFLLHSISSIKVGTVNNELESGVNFMAGSFQNPYESSPIPSKDFSYYIFGQMQAAFTAYDASLQGGLFNHDSPYSIPSANLERFTVQADFGIVMNYKKLILEYRQSLLTREFEGGNSHRWGGITIGVKI